MVRRASSNPPGRLVHPLSYVRWERNWTLQDLVDVIARRINTANRREKAWRWEHWGVEPDVDTQLALAAELGVPAELVRTLRWPDWLPIGERIDTDAPWTVEGGLALLDSAGGALLDRRGFLILSSGTAVSVANNWLTIEPPQLVSALRGGRVDAGLVSCFEQRLPALRRIDHTLGGGHVGTVVDSELTLVTNLLSSGSYSASTGRRLFAVAAELGRIAGWASCDAGLHAAAERYWIAALRAAHLAKDRGIGANILKSMSLQQAEAQRLDEALALARAARDGARQAPARVVAMLTIRQARAHASRGEANECEKLLVAAEEAMSRADDEPAPSWAAYFDEAEYCAQVAACYLLMRRYKATDRWLGQTLALQPDERSRDRATYFIWRADSVLNLGEVEHACTLLGEAIPDIASARSARNRKRLLEVHDKLSKHRRLPAVQELQERLKPLITSAA
ncbi:transcriptional regulator [Microbispora sp. H13382]|uniref:transcriptional regulator n=1 Tax=Microbispora sp. H13382 TaxID=2729112 RepID=UPI0016012491|nr:transcriptional regulator [Microbispora sp. H13382]